MDQLEGYLVESPRALASLNIASSTGAWNTWHGQEEEFCQPVGTPAAVQTPKPLATFPGSHIPTSFYAVLLPGQDRACISCLGMCLAERA